ncbi:MAG: amidohydrolase family protein [Acetobacteraceae bacterium]|nr:amidohydrolase family protein [Acetobacteraceae bacterium]
MTPPLLIDGALVCDEGAARTGSVLVRGGLIDAVATYGEDRAALRSRAGEIVTGSGRWLMPGLIDAHAHAYSTLLRGTENSLPLELWALHTMLYGRGFDVRLLRTAILLGAAERIRAGITGMVDHSPPNQLGLASIAAHEESGMRVAYAAFLHDLSDYDLLDMSLPPDVAAAVGAPPPLDEEAYARRFASFVQAARAGSGRVQVQLGPNAPQRCSPRAWALWRTLRDRHDVAVHTHLLETRAQASLNRRWPGGLVAEMAREGLLEGRLTCAHGVWLTDAERDVLARCGVTVSHNPASNLMLGSGVMNFRSCTACGLCLALGTDSANTGGRHDIFGVMRLAMMLPRVNDPATAHWPDAAQVFDAATLGGAAALGMKGRLGRIAPGQRADFVLVRAGDAGTIAAEPSVAALVQHGGPENVDAVMVDGRWVLREGRIVAFDEDAVRRGAVTLAYELHDRVAAALPALRATIPPLAARLAGLCG